MIEITLVTFQSLASPHIKLLKASRAIIKGKKKGGREEATPIFKRMIKYFQGCFLSSSSNCVQEMSGYLPECLW